MKTSELVGQEPKCNCTVPHMLKVILCSNLRISQPKQTTCPPAFPVVWFTSSAINFSRPLLPLQYTEADYHLIWPLYRVIMSYRKQDSDSEIMSSRLLETTGTWNKNSLLPSPVPQILKEAITATGKKRIIIIEASQKEGKDSSANQDTINLGSL